MLREHPGGPSNSEDNNSGGVVKPKTKMCTIFW